MGEENAKSHEEGTEEEEDKEVMDEENGDDE